MSKKLDQIHLMKLFVAIVQRGTFAGGASSLNITATKASKDIQYLERLIESTLIRRSTRSFQLTDAGELYYQKALHILDVYDQMRDNIVSMKVNLSGELRVAAPSLWGSVVLTPLILKFKQLHPGVKIISDFSNELHNLMQDNIHVTFRSTELKNEPYLAKYICKDESVLCASAAYLHDSNTITHLDDLTAHKFISLAQKHTEFDHLIFDHKGQEVHQHLVGHMAFNNKDAMYQAVKAGLGIAVLPSYLVQKDIESEALFEVLPEYQLQSSQFYALYTQRKKESALVSKFIDFVQESLA